MPSLYADVLLPLSLRKCRYTYIVPKGMEQQELLYRLVSVSYGPGKVYSGLIVDLSSTLPDPSIKYKPILNLHPYPSLPPSTWQLLSWMAEYYMCSEGEVFKAMIPAAYRPDGETHYTVNTEGKEGNRLSEALKSLPKVFTLKQFKRNFPEVSFKDLSKLLQRGDIIVSETQELSSMPKVIKGWCVSTSLLSDVDRLEEIRKALGRSPKGLRVLEQIVENHKTKGDSDLSHRDSIPMSLNALSEKYMVGIGVINKLRGHGVFEEKEMLLQSSIFSPIGISSDVVDELSDCLKDCFKDQKIVLAHLPGSSIHERIPYAFISDILKSGGQVLLLLPTQDVLQQLTPGLEANFSKDALFQFHSDIPVRDRNNTWYQTLNGKSGLYVGLRKAALLPFSKLRSVVVVDEEHTGYKQFEPAPRFNALNVALVLARLTQSTVVMTTATPSVDRQIFAKEGRYAYVSVPMVKKGIDCEIVSLKESFEKNKVRGRLLSFELMDAIRETLHRGEQSLLLLHRKGYARSVICEECNIPIKCQKCKVPYRYFEHSKSIVCPFCGHHEPVPQTCPECGHESLTFEGTGVERLATEVAHIYPEAQIATITDKLSDVSQNLGADIILSSDNEVPRALLDRVSLIAIVQFDLLAMMHDFRANERAYRLLCQFENESPHLKKIVIQYLIDNQNALLAFRDKNYMQLFEHELQERFTVHYPPFSRMIDIYVESSDKKAAQDVSTNIVSHCRKYEDLSVFGPAPRPNRKQWVEAGYKVSIMIPLTSDLGQIRQQLYEATDSALEKANNRNTRIYFDVDPIY
ncbi:primosomal protein N' [Porphyromonas sp.]|uniref:replication restart helicase PriA n=1 Tax=Porphyromonas sp. TaxID=1924944 RepID=UPI0026DA7379|nr:primosomal protein N' [Porphyromonas sp.]MDO4770312.1 primosomal protein N' [Porphyromonas sp.]